MRRFLATLLLVAKAANAECQNSGPNVVCDKPSFDKLMDVCVEADKGATVCAIKLAAAEEGAVQAQRALDACIAAVPPPPPKPSALRPVIGYTLGVLGAVAASLALSLDLAPSTRAALGISGMAAVGAGVSFVLP